MMTRTKDEGRISIFDPEASDTYVKGLANMQATYYMQDCKIAGSEVGSYTCQGSKPQTPRPKPWMGNPHFRKTLRFSQMDYLVAFAPLSFCRRGLHRYPAQSVDSDEARMKA